MFKLLHYIKAENLKCNKTFAKKLILIAPIFMIILASINANFFVENGFNWWYIMIFPSYLTLLSALVNQIEDKKLNYRAVFSLPISLMKTWLSKILLISIYSVISSAIYMAGMIFGKLSFNTSTPIQVDQIIIASIVIMITSLWQIPFCLFLSKKFSFLTTVLMNTGVGLVLGILIANKSFWWLCPYSYSTRLMCPVLGILPNGLMAKPNDLLLNTNVIPIGLILSLALFITISALTAFWFKKQEVQ